MRGFTLIEILVVIAIIGILSAIVLGSLATARDNGSIAAGQEFADHIYHSVGDTTVGIWSLDETGTSFTDRSGYNNTCTATGGVTSTTGVYKTALLFDGTSGYLLCGTNSALALTSKWTVSFWIKPTAIGSFMTILDGDGMGDPTGTYDFYVDAAGRIEFETNNIGAIYSTGTVVAGKWQQVTITFDSSQNPNTYFYINGNSAGSGNATAPSAFTMLDIGRRGAGSYFNGAIDDVKIFNQAGT